MKRRTLPAIAAIASAALLVLAACGDDGDNGDKDKSIQVLGTDGNSNEALGEEFSKDKGSLANFRGTTPLTELSSDFQDRLHGVNPDITTFNYAGESYDAVTIAALAAELARSNSGTTFAPFINGVTTGGEKCTSFQACKTLIDAGKDIDYDGVSGPLEFTEPGEPSVASFGLLEFDDAGKMSVAEYLIAGDKAKAVSTAPTAAPRDQSASGTFKVGTLLPHTGSLSAYGPSMTGGAHLAVKEINAAGGVNGGQVTTEDRDDGTDPTVAGTSADALLQADVSVVIGAAGSTVSKSVLEKITSAGVVMISPSNTSDEFTTIADNGLYFRTAPPDVLQSQPLANLILDDGADRVAVLYQETAYGKGLADNVKTNLVAADVPDGDVLLIAYDPNGRDFTAEVEQAKSHKPEYVLVIGYNESNSIIKKLNEKGIGPKK